MTASAFGVEFRGITKTFPGVAALKDVSFGVRRGSIHALMGENGAGKSTLLKILAGAYRPTSGQLVLAEQPVDFRSTADALAAGTSIIYQELHLVPEMSVAENLYLGHTPHRAGIVRWEPLLCESRRILEMLGEDIDPKRRVADLSIGQRQMVEIGKALTRDAAIIAFDEPTSSLSDREIERLFAVIRGLRDRGHTILYVSHRMQEIFALCDAVTVLRDGAHVETFPDIAHVTEEMLIQRMVGRSLSDIYAWRSRTHGAVALAAESVIGPGLGQPVSFSVASGEILGIFGLIGAGRTELMKLIYGAAHRTGGAVQVAGQPIAAGSPAKSVESGLVFCPEDRKKEGIFPVQSVMENINISVRRNHSSAGFVINHSWELRNAAEYAKQLDVRTPSLRQSIMNLSGGNQQKAILARWLSEKVKVILLDEPTRGIDVGAKSEIYNIIYRLAESGIGVVLVSSDLPEVLGVCDRILVMREGAISATFSRDEADQEAVLRHALPISGGQAA